MAVYREVERFVAQNGSLASGATENVLPTSRINKKNGMIVTNDSSQKIAINLNGDGDNRLIIPAASVAFVKPEEGLFFDWVQIENLGTAAIDADDIEVRLSTSIKVVS